MRIQKIGNWEQAFERLKELKSIIAEEVEIAFEETAAEAVDLLRGHIEQQDLGWRPLSEEYLLSKAKDGFAQETLMRSKKMYESITSKSSKGGFWAGVPEGEQSDEGQSISMIAAIHEFGADSVGIEPRPLYGPTVNELKEWMKKNIDLDARILRRLQK